MEFSPEAEICHQEQISTPSRTTAIGQTGCRRDRRDRVETV
ncbi:MAG: hypothetical protein ACP5D7_20765 [Limnospira sp.]